MDGRIAVVTGGSGGIGRAIAARLLDGGAAVAVHYGRSAEPAEQLVADAQARGRTAIAVHADLSRAEAAAALIDEVERRLGPVDVVVANHGIGIRRSSFADLDVRDWDATFAVNTRAAFLLAQRALPGMQERRFGRLLFTSSVAALTGGVIGPDYAASKAALHGLLHYLAPKVAADGVTVNAIAPALITGTGMLPGQPDELAQRIPVGRLGTPDEVADLAVAVLANGYVTDQVISVDGGMYPR